MMKTSSISAKGQIVIPAHLRKKYGLKPGKKVAFLEEHGYIVLKPMDESFFSQYAGMLKDSANERRILNCGKWKRLKKKSNC